MNRPKWLYEGNTLYWVTDKGTIVRITLTESDVTKLANGKTSIINAMPVSVNEYGKHLFGTLDKAFEISNKRRGEA